MADDEMAKKIMGNFHTYQTKEVIPEEVTEEESKTQSKVRAIINKDFSIY